MIGLLDGVIEAVDWPRGRPYNPGPWTVVEKATGQESLGARCCTGTFEDARGTADFWNRRYKTGKYEARLR